MKEIASNYVFKYHSVLIAVIVITVYLRTLLLVCCIEINEDHPNEDRVYSELTIAGLSLAVTQAGRTVGMLYNEKWKASGTL